MDPTTRIIEHMNADHQDSLVRYLEHQYGVSSFTARKARMTKVTLSSLQITTSGDAAKANSDNTYTVVLDPPLKSFGEMRERLVKMDHEAIAALRRDPITVKKYTPPRGFHLALFVTVLTLYLFLHRRANLAPATAPQWIRRNFILKFPRLSAFLYRVQPLVFWPTLLIHIGEVTWLIKSRLAVHSIPVCSRLWLTWAASTFIEGFGAFQRFDAIVAQEKKKKEKAKH